jgi:hypothetical protein
MAKTVSNQAQPEVPSKGKMLRSFLPLLVVFGLRYLPFNEEQNIFVGRIVFAFKFVLTALVAMMIYLRIQNTPYKPTDMVKEHEEQGEIVPSMSFGEYDKKQLVVFLKSQLMPSAITAFIHYKFSYVQPLYISTVMALMTLYDWNLFQIYILNRDGSEDKALRRPFQSANSPGFMETMNKKVQEAQEQAEKKSK